MTPSTFFVKEIPVVIEPGVGILEASMTVVGVDAVERTVVAHLFRLPLDETAAASLPFVPTTQRPHVFTLHDDFERSPLLLVYDQLGRLAVCYYRDERGRSWHRQDVSAEHAGRTITQFSVRFCFNDAGDRNRFLHTMKEMVDGVKQGKQPTKRDMAEALSLLARSRVAPVTLPVAVAGKQEQKAPT